MRTKDNVNSPPRRVSLWRTVLATMTLLGATLVGVATTGAPAQAGCFGSGAPYEMVTFVGGLPRAHEFPIEGCDGNGFYDGVIADVIAGDGFCAWVTYYPVTGGALFIGNVCDFALQYFYTGAAANYGPWVNGPTPFGQTLPTFGF